MSPCLSVHIYTYDLPRVGMAVPVGTASHDGMDAEFTSAAPSSSVLPHVAVHLEHTSLNRHVSSSSFCPHAHIIHIYVHVAETNYARRRGGSSTYAYTHIHTYVQFSHFTEAVTSLHCGTGKLRYVVMGFLGPTTNNDCKSSTLQCACAADNSIQPERAGEPSATQNKCHPQPLPVARK